LNARRSAGHRYVTTFSGQRSSYSLAVSSMNFFLAAAFPASVPFSSAPSRRSFDASARASAFVGW